MKTLLTIVYILLFGFFTYAQEIEFSLQASAKKYREITSSYGYSFGFNKTIKGGGRTKINLIHEFGKRDWASFGFDMNQDEFTLYKWEGDIFHNNLFARLQIDLDLTKSQKSNVYLGIHSTFGYIFIKYDGWKKYDPPLEEYDNIHQTRKKTTFIYPNIGVNFEYEFALNKHAFAIFLQPAFTLFKNEDLNQSGSSVLECITAGLAYRFNFRPEK